MNYGQLAVMGNGIYHFCIDAILPYEVVRHDMIHDDLTNKNIWLGGFCRRKQAGDVDSTVNLLITDYVERKIIIVICGYTYTDEEV